MSGCWKITWLYIYLDLSFLLSSCYLLPLSNQNQSVVLFLFHISTQFMIKKKRFKLVICVCRIMLCYEVFLSQYDVFQHSMNCTKKKKKKRQPWWQPLVNTSLFFQFWENIISFNFLANTLSDHDTAELCHIQCLFTL